MNDSGIIKMNTADVLDEVRSGFAAVYKNAAPFVGSGELWDFCMEVLGDPVLLSCIVFANDMEIPPVKSLLTIYAREKHPTVNFSGVQNQYLGALMGFVFKYVLHYQAQKERCTVNYLGVKTAARFLDGPVYRFEA